jgi:hypothetical protein
MSEPNESEFTAPEAVNVSVAQIHSLPDKLLLTVWTDDQQRFVLSLRMAKFLSGALAQAVEKLSLPRDEH